MTVPLPRQEDLPVPLIDIKQPGAAQAVREACTQHGFMYVANHDVPDELVARQFEESRKFFALPFEEKMKVEADSKARGYTPLGEQTLDPKHQTRPDTKESYYIWSPDVPADSPEAQLPLHGTNQWPPADMAPGFKPVMQAYHKAMAALSLRVLPLIAEALHLPREYFLERFTNPLMTLRPIHYTAEESKPDQGVLGAGAHTDWGFLTYLVTDTTPGLQIWHQGAWVDVPPIPGAFVCNIGDLLQQWTNGTFKSTLHRVVNLVPGRERYSCAFFTSPDYDAVVECLPTCAEGGPKFPPVTCATYLEGKYAATHAGYAQKNKGPAAEE
ncbi:hypothetical protein WJX73_003920 [Symbiochloris irregularis]|uniref:Fe2OG dioxygenase domain-containing protein n=1 Tax=Symbiochloris irregularis TaxID=706552 RepID=A0AAW1P0V1_9CHLO